MYTLEVRSDNKDISLQRTQGGTKDDVWRALVNELKQCGRKKDLKGGKLVHTNAKETGYHTNRYVAHTLISMYSKCGSMQDAREVFESMLQHDAVSWNSLMLGYVENGESLLALDMFVRMDSAPDSVTFVAALKACSVLVSAQQFNKKVCLEKGMAIHRQAKDYGFDQHEFMPSTLIDMYSKCGSIRDAIYVFEKALHRDTVCWTNLIQGYVENGEFLAGIQVFNSMDCPPDSYTFVAALKACTSMATEKHSNKKACMEKGMAIHKQARERGFDKHVYVANTLVDMYSKCGSMRDARYVFENMHKRDAISWNSLILGYVENAECLVALDVFASMDCAPDCFTFSAALKACACLGAESQFHKNTYLEKGMAIHRRARERGLDRNIIVATTLVEMYSNCGTMHDARYVFERMVQHDVASWNSLILGYVESGEGLVALSMFTSMDCIADGGTFAAALRACGSLGALETGERIHERIRKVGLEQDEKVGTCLVDFYGRCGKMASAEEVFNKMHSRNIVTWTALIGGYTSLGDTSQVFTVVKRMQESNVHMDGVTVLLVLTACSHSGKVDEGRKYFDSMLKCGITPCLKHYACMVDMLGRANRLQEALSVLTSMPFEADSVVWMTLLGACKKWNNMEIGKVAFDALIARNEDKEHVASAYVLMGEIYRRLGMRPEEEQIEERRKAMRAWKNTGNACLCNVNGTVYSFVMGDRVEEQVIDKLQSFLPLCI